MWIVLTYSVYTMWPQNSFIQYSQVLIKHHIRFGLLLFFFGAFFDVKIKLQDFRARRILKRLFGDVSALYRLGNRPRVDLPCVCRWLVAAPG